MHKKDPLGLYIHIPFCSGKCKYCDFYSLPKSENLYFEYTKKAAEAVEYYSKKYARPYNSLYFGGGTPLLLGEGQLAPIFKAASPYLLPNSEVTCEGNPGAETKTDFSRLKDLGVNRLSFGLQSSDNTELAALGRRHFAKDAEATVAAAQKAGIDNISLDLMLGIPYQTEKSLLESIRFCANLGVKHISAYMLKIEEGTPLSKDSNLCALCADEEKAADLYLLACEELSALGYAQYEISNFAKPGFESRHNLKYWNAEEYIGIGPGAHSFTDERRWYFERNIGEFLEKPFAESEREESTGGNWEEYAMLRLRLTEGLDLNLLSLKYPNAPAAQILQSAKGFAKTGLFNLNKNCISFTPKGFLVANALTAELLYR